MVKKVLFSSCLLISSFAVSKPSMPSCEPCAFGQVDNHEIELRAERLGEDMADLLFDIFTTLGQGRIFEDLKSLNARAKEINRRVKDLGKADVVRKADAKIKNIGTIFFFVQVPRLAAPGLIQGMIKGMEKVSTEQFIQAARLVSWQAEIFREMYEFVLKYLRVLSQLNVDQWDTYRQAQYEETKAFLRSISERVERELEISKTGN